MTVNFCWLLCVSVLVSIALTNAVPVLPLDFFTTTTPASPGTGRVLALSVAYAGHSTPVIELAKAMAARGHEVTFASSDNFPTEPFGKRIQFSESPGSLRFLPLGAPLYNKSELANWMYAQIAAAEAKDGRYARMVVDMYDNVHAKFMKAAHGIISKGDFDVVIMDCATTAGFDLAELLEVPLVYVHGMLRIGRLAHILHEHIPWTVPQGYEELPAHFSPLQALQHLKYVLQLRWKVATQAIPYTPPVRKSNSTFIARLWQKQKWHPLPLVIVTSVFALEPAQRLPPHILQVGPLVAPSEPLSADLASWLDQEPGKPVVYMAFGTLVNFHDATYLAILRALISNEYRVLWAIRPRSGSIMEGVVNGTSGAPTVPANYRLIHFAPQVELLRHPVVRVAVMHGGYNSVTEALHFGKPIVGVPGWGDQAYNIFRAAQFGAALRVDRKAADFDQQLRTSVETVLRNNSFTQAAQRLGVLSRLAPGADSAAKAIESVMYSGSTAHLAVPNNVPSLAYGLAVLLAASAVFAWFVYKTLQRCLSGLRGGARGKIARIISKED